MQNMINQKLIDEEYDYLKDVVYINCSLISMPPRRVRETWKEYIEGYASTFATVFPVYFDDKVKEARKNISKLLRVDPEEIAFTHSVSDSMAILAQSYPFEDGDNVIITNEEHASNVIPWLALEKRGISVKVVHSTNGVVEAQAIIDAMDDHTKVVSVAAAFFCSGYRMDLKTLGDACKKNGTCLCVDGTQTVGRYALYPRELGVDYYAGSGHKGLLGTKSIGFSYCSKELLKILQPSTGSLQSVPNAGRPCKLEHYADIEWIDTAAKLESGNYPYALIEAISMGTSFLNELGIEEVEKRIMETEAKLIELLKDIPLKTNIAPEGYRSGILFVYFPEGADPAKVKEILLKHKVMAVVRYDYIRFSIHVYNSPEQMQRVADALKEVAAL